MPLKITVIGAGAAGLNTSIHLRRFLNADVTILERAEEHETPGLGVALLSFARDEMRLIGLGDFVDGGAYGMPISTTTRVFAGSAGGPLAEEERIQEVDYWGVRRSELVAKLRRAAADEGVRIEYRTDITPDRVRTERSACDVLVGADGAGSVVRSTFAEEFKPTIREATSRYAWLQLTGRLEQFVFGYIYLPGQGLVRITAYPHAKDECSAIITHSAGLSGMLDGPGMLDADGSLSTLALETINGFFAKGLGGHRIVGSSRWRKFRATSCATAASGNVALVGDAFATIHYETGWGTSAALQNARIFCHILAHSRDTGLTLPDGMAVYARKTGEITAALVETTARVMDEVDGQADVIAEIGTERFMTLATP
ncbi:MAG: FAD-dependent monooxygenase [Bauldia sp.]|nr:FAD-dependent monooxygenase [Bauldia sp.]